VILLQIRRGGNALIAKYTTGVQHIGIPTNDIEKTLTFYHGLGFETTLRTVDPATNTLVAFLQLKNLVLETYQTGEACEKAGAIDHIALDVIDIEKVYAEIKAGGHKMLNSQIQSLPFWEKGVRFFTIEGPNAERIEFSQKL
jgi:lactoylglutathione lyase